MNSGVMAGLVPAIQLGASFQTRVSRMAQELVPSDEHWEGASAFRFDRQLRDGSRSGVFLYLTARSGCAFAMGLAQGCLATCHPGRAGGHIRDPVLNSFVFWVPVLPYKPGKLFL
tara:strand:- start:13247 stop:13591 length:345 start_codon:yes stop_codon:yes gene_type:complete